MFVRKVFGDREVFFNGCGVGKGVVRDFWWLMG